MSTSSLNEPLSGDELLLEQFRQGNKEAFATIYKRYVSRLKAFVVGVIKDEPTADEILTEVFLKLFYRRQEIDKFARISPWLIIFSRNIILQYLRNSHRHIDFRFGSEEAQEEYIDLCLIIVFPNEYALIKEADFHGMDQKLLSMLADGKTTGEIAKNLNLDFEDVLHQRKEIVSLLSIQYDIFPSC